MSSFEMMGWANSDESKGWLVRYRNLNKISEWQLPQRFSYAVLSDPRDLINDTTERPTLIYERAKLLPNHRNIDKSTIQGFKIKDTDYDFVPLPDKKQKQQEPGYER
jgi:hypothetical protein